MKQLIIGDIHGRSLWKKIIENNPDFDRLIVLGDYFDSFNIHSSSQLENFRDLCLFKRTSNKHVVLLIGNHDHHYMPTIREQYSGYQHHMRSSFEKELECNSHLLQVAFCDEYNNVYSHAGISLKWLEHVGAPELGSARRIVSYVNTLYINQPHKFNFYKDDRSYCGNHPKQSPIWIRPDMLYWYGIPYKEIIGHTAVGHILLNSKAERKGFYQIDCLENNFYLSCIDGVFKVNTL